MQWLSIKIQRRNSSALKLTTKKYTIYLKVKIKGHKTRKGFQKYPTCQQFCLKQAGAGNFGKILKIL